MASSIEYNDGALSRIADSVMHTVFGHNLRKNSTIVSALGNIAAPGSGTNIGRNAHIRELLYYLRQTGIGIQFIGPDNETLHPAQDTIRYLEKLILDAKTLSSNATPQQQCVMLMQFDCIPELQDYVLQEFQEETANISLITGLEYNATGAAEAENPADTTIADMSGIFGQPTPPDGFMLGTLSHVHFLMSSPPNNSEGALKALYDKQPGYAGPELPANISSLTKFTYSVPGEILAKILYMQSAPNPDILDTVITLSQPNP